MKRHPALIALSHDHHQILMLARQLRRTRSGSDASEGADAVRGFLAGLRAHFQVEEEAVADGELTGDLGSPASATAARHDQLSRRMDLLASSGAQPPDPAALRQLGESLAEYVRWQEREVFQSLQQALPTDLLATIGDRVTELRDPTACRVRVKVRAVKSGDQRGELG